MDSGPLDDFDVSPGFLFSRIFSPRPWHSVLERLDRHFASKIFKEEAVGKATTASLEVDWAGSGSRETRLREKIFENPRYTRKRRWMGHSLEIPQKQHFIWNFPNFRDQETP